MKKKSKAISRLRQVGPKFRLNRHRDDLSPPLFHTAFIFCPSRILHSGETGVFGSPVVVLQGYEVLSDTDKLKSVKAKDDSFVVGRMVELHTDELARLDQVAEAAGDYHRFLTEVVGPQAGTKFSVWVYQKREHASELDLKTSAAELPAPSTRQLKLL
jgi:gamma-glutamylcyclotransferase (GGCT)/AIG2-like uncharacterized protein YtfP